MTRGLPLGQGPNIFRLHRLEHVRTTGTYFGQGSVVEEDHAVRIVNPV